MDSKNTTVTSAKNKRYDRQLRIWGAHGQAQLEGAKICLLHCGPTGSETLKDLVLAGIGSFTIVDGSKVLPHDVGNNYLVQASSLGESKAKVGLGSQLASGDAAIGAVHRCFHAPAGCDWSIEGTE
jgi:molybdopterin/thiamine biosynthesis adenylyltransferase